MKNRIQPIAETGIQSSDETGIHSGNEANITTFDCVKLVGACKAVGVEPVALGRLWCFVNMY